MGDQSCFFSLCSCCTDCVIICWSWECIWIRFAVGVMHYYNHFFLSTPFRLGIIITRKPWFFIVGCVIFTATCSNGLFNFTAENAPMKLWIPQDSGFVENTNWLNDNFPNDIRFHSMIYEGDNLLNPEFLGWVRNWLTMMLLQAVKY